MKYKSWQTVKIKDKITMYKEFWLKLGNIIIFNSNEIAYLDEIFWKDVIIDSVDELRKLYIVKHDWESYKIWEDYIAWTDKEYKLWEIDW